MALPDGLGPTSPVILLIVDHLKKYSTEKERGTVLLTGVRYAYFFKLLQIILFIIFPLPKKNSTVTIVIGIAVIAGTIARHSFRLK